MALALLVIGSGVLGLAIALRGLPWEFGPRSAVVLEVSGDCELTTGTERKKLEPTDDLMPGDKIAVGVLSFSRVSMRSGTAELDARSSAVFNNEVIRLLTGRMELDLVKSLTVEFPNKEAVQISAGRYLVLGGGSHFGVLVREGTAVSKDVVARSGELLSGGAVKKPGQVETVNLTKTGAVFRGEARPLTQVVVNGAIVGYPDAKGALVLDAAADGANVVLARDAFDRAVPVSVGEPIKQEDRRRRRRRRGRR